MSKQFGDLQFIGYGEREYYEQFFEEPEPEKSTLICMKSSLCGKPKDHSGECDDSWIRFKSASPSDSTR